MRVLLTGASGFVGSHVLRHLLVTTDWEVVCPVTFRHKGVPARMHSAMEGRDTRRVKTVMLDLTAPVDRVTLFRLGGIDAILNVASESHVDRSIQDPIPFVMNNTAVMLNVLEMARYLRPALFLQMSTDEVYGPAPLNYSHREWDTVIPSNPYSASKAAQEAIAISYWRTYGVPLVLTNTMNIIGEMQDPEKFLPRIIRSLRDGTDVPVHVSPDGTPGSRFYLHARNLADAWTFLVGDLVERVPLYPDADRPYRVNIVGDRETPNDELVRMVGAYMGLRPDYVDRLIRPVSFHSSRPGHDLRYALDGSRLDRLGWRAPVGFETALDRTVDWTLKHQEWLDL